MTDVQAIVERIVNEQAESYEDSENLAGWCQPVDWSTFWAQESVEQDWLIEPLVPAGRQVAIYSRAKVGKSLLALDIAAAAATGQPILGCQPAEAFHVVYVDLEMTEADIRERLTDLGYGPDDNLSRLHYYLLPALPPLDTDLGGRVLAAIAARYDASLIVVDTMARAVNGDENQADTYRDFYKHTGRRLKADRRALLRLDHSGKDPAQGQRGSSAKADDLDVVFAMTIQGEGFTLNRTHSRIPWVPVTVDIQRHEEPLRHVLTTGLWPNGTADTAAILDQLHVPLDATALTAQTALKKAGHGRRKQVVIAALKWRRRRFPDPGNRPSNTTVPEPSGTGTE